MNDATGPGTGPTAAVVIPVQRATQAAARRRHPLPARPVDQGRSAHLLHAEPRRADRSRPAAAERGTDGKVIYSTREAAEAAARELESLGARPLRSYLCGRSRSGHFHLTTDTAARAEHAPGPGVDPGAARPALGLTAIGQMDPTSPAYTTTLSG